MATVVKDFKIKSGLVVEGTTGTINTYDILTKKQADQDYIIGLIGGTATHENTPDTVVKRDEDGSFAAEIITAEGGFVGNLTGDVTGTVSDLSNHNTDDLSEGTGNKYFTDTRAKDAVSAALGDGIEYESGDFNVKIADGLAFGGGTGNEIEIDRTTVDTWYDSNGAAAQALTDAQGYADQAELDAIAAAALDATDKADAAEDAANSYTDGRETAITTAYQAYADQAETDAKAYTDTRETAITTAYQAYADQAEADAKSYADDKVADLVNGAPALLDTLNELAAALEDNPDVIADLREIADGKQNTLTAGANIDITGDTISVTGLDTADVAEDASRLYFTDERAVDANTGLWDTIGAAAAALEDAQDYADQAETDAVSSANTYTDTRETAITTAYQSYADTAEADAKTYADGLVSDLQDVVDALSTDDVTEGSNLYYTESRAKSDAASLLTGATLTNITITGDGSGLTITAENGVADSSTDDLAEGEDNLYFTDSRAVTALEAVVPNFTAVEFNSVAKQVAAEATVATASTSNALTWAKADYRSAEFLVKIKQGNHTEVSKLVLTMDASDNIAITEYAMVGTNGDLGSYSAAVSGTDVALTVTTLNNNSDVMVVGTLLK